MSDAQKREINVGDQNKGTQATQETTQEKTKGQIKREKKKAALTRILNFVKSNTKDTNLLKDVAFLTPGNRSTVRSTPATAILEAFNQKAEWHENELWEKFKVGRGEMRKICRKLIKDAKKPEDRVWIDFNSTTGKYKMVHKGKEMPKAWTGYKPVTAADLVVK